MKLQLETDIISMRTQIQRARMEARQTGKYADPHWWLKIHQALRIKGKQCQHIQNRLRSQREQRVETLESRFLTIARRDLPEATFQKLLQEAQA